MSTITLLLALSALLYTNMSCTAENTPSSLPTAQAASPLSALAGQLLAIIHHLIQGIDDNDDMGEVIIIQHNVVDLLNNSSSDQERHNNSKKLLTDSECYN